MSTIETPRVIDAGQLYPLREAERRLGWGRKTTAKAIKAGLSVVKYGREKYVRGQALIDFLKRMEREATDTDIPASS